MKKQIKVFLVMLLFLLFIGTTTVNAGMVTPDSVAEGTYIIGTNMFTGGITSQEMMYAARSIKIPEEVTEPIKQLEYMNMYTKDLEGEWINGINGQPIAEANLPKQFYIECKDLVEIKAVTVSTAEELKTAIEDETVERIILQEWIELEESIEINRSVTLAGMGGIFLSENAIDVENVIIIGENGILVIEDNSSINIDTIENNGLIINGIPVEQPLVRQVALMSLQYEEPAYMCFYGVVQNNGKIINNGYMDLQAKVQGNGTLENNKIISLWAGVELSDIQGLKNNGEIEKYVGETAEELQAVLNNKEITTVSLTQNIEIQESIVINRPVTLCGCGYTISFETRPDEWITDGNNYVLKVYNTEATISEIGLTNSLAGMLVASSDVTLRGNIDVSGNTVGGIEVSKGSGLTREPSLKMDNEYWGNIYNEQEYNMIPTVWEDGVENCVDLESFGLEKVTGYEENKTFYFSTIPYIEVTSVGQLEKLLKTNIEEINLGADFTTDHSIVINRPVTIYGNGKTISFETMPDEWVDDGDNYVLKVYNTEATISNIGLTNALAGMLVSSSDVTLNGNIDVSGNKVGGIEVSKGSELTREPSLKSDTDWPAYIMNNQEYNLIPTVWEDGVENCVDLDSLQLTKVTGIEPNKTFYLKDESVLSVDNVEKLEKLLATNIEVIKLGASFSTDHSIVINRPVTIEGQGYTISFETMPDEWVDNGDNYVLKVYNTEATISNIGLTNALAGMLVSSSDVTLDGNIDVNGNKVGGIEVSKGSELTRKPSLTLVENANIINYQEENLIPTVWEDGVENCVTANLQKVTGYEENKTFYFNTLPNIQVTSVGQLEKLLKTNIEVINIGSDFTTDHSIVINRPVTINGNYATISFETQPEQWIQNGDNYVLKIYNTEAKICNLNLTNALAGMLVSSADVTVSGSINVSGNKVGGIEVSKGSELTRKPSLKVDSEMETYIINDQEYNLIPTVWEDGVENCVDLDLEKVTGYEENKTFYFNTLPDIQVTSVGQLEKLLKTNIEVIKLGASFTTDHSIVINRPVTIEGQGNTISFETQPEQWVDNGDNYVLKVYNTEAKICNLSLTNALAGMLVASSDVILSGNIDVSGNAVGGIEVSKASGLTRQPSLKVDTEFATYIYNAQEQNMIPTIWEDGVTGTVTIDLTKIEDVENNKVYYFQNAPTVVTTEAELEAAIADENIQKIALLADINLTKTMRPARDLTIELNGKTIDGTNVDYYYAFYVTGGKLVINGEGSIVTSGEGTANRNIRAKGAEVILNNVKLVGEYNIDVDTPDPTIKGKATINNSTLESTQFGVTAWSDSEVNIVDSKVKSEVMAISGNGLESNAIINVIGSEVESTGDTAIYMPSTEKLTITDSKVKGLTSLEAAAGTIEIAGSELTATGEYNEYTTPKAGDGTWADGSTIFLRAQKGYNKGGKLTLTLDEKTRILSTNGNGIRIYEHPSNTAEDYGVTEIDVTYYADNISAGLEKIVEQYKVSTGVNVTTTNQTL